jgi:hypothetical protein
MHCDAAPEYRPLQAERALLRQDCAHPFGHFGFSFFIQMLQKRLRIYIL